jgi:hypothetical protein
VSTSGADKIFTLRIINTLQYKVGSIYLSLCISRPSVCVLGGGYLFPCLISHVYSSIHGFSGSALGILVKIHNEFIQPLQVTAVVNMFKQCITAATSILFPYIITFSSQSVPADTVFSQKTLQSTSK